MASDQAEVDAVADAQIEAQAGIRKFVASVVKSIFMAYFQEISHAEQVTAVKESLSKVIEVATAGGKDDPPIVHELEGNVAEASAGLVKSVIKAYIEEITHKESAQAVADLMGSFVKVAQAASVHGTDAYVAHQIGTTPVGVDPETIINSLRNGVPAEEVYHRPFVTTFSEFKAGTDREQAINMGADRAGAMAEADVQMAMRATAQHLQDENPDILGWQRKADPTACPFCVKLDGVKVKHADAMPLHPRCGCSIVPVLRSFHADPLPDDVGVHDHGEMGATFTGPEPEVVLGVTPFRGKGDVGSEYYDTPRYKGFENDVHQLTTKYGATLVQFDRVRGMWAGGSEPSSQITLRGGDAMTIADKLGAKYNQDAVLHFTIGNGKSIRYVSKTPVDQAAVAKAMANSDLGGATFLPDGHVEIVDFDGSGTESVTKLAEALGVQWRYERGTAGLRERGKDYTFDPSAAHPDSDP